MDFKEFKDSKDFRDQAADDEDEDSEPTSVAMSIIANPALEEDCDYSGNLGTIPELPELGYQSDNSDTELLLPR